MKLYLKTILLFLVFSSCTTTVQQEQVFNDTFNAEELIYLNEIEELVYGQICKEQKQTDLNSCFKMYSSAAFDVFSKDHDAIFPMISYEKVWGFLEKSNQDDLALIWNKRISGQGLSLNPDSKFFKLLKTQDQQENHLINRIIQQQDITPGDIVHLFSYPEKYDLNSHIVRLTIAIDLITQIDREKEKTTPKS